MKNHRFPWLRNRTTDNRKCEKARNIKEKCTIEMFNTASKPHVALLSSASAEPYSLRFQEPLLRWRLLFYIFASAFLCMLGQEAAVRRKISYSNRDRRERSAQ